jgi:tetratricopeptide (TPR) repeat protein
MIVFVLLGTGVVLRASLGLSEKDRLLHQAAKHLMADRHEWAERYAYAVLQQEPQSPLALLIAGEAAAGLRLRDEAIRYFQRVSDAEPAEAVHALYRAGEELMVAGKARQAEESLRWAIQHDPGHTMANKQLAFLLQSQGRTWESAPFIRRAYLNGYIAKDNLMMLALIDTTYLEQYQFVENCRKADPHNCVVLLARARHALDESLVDQARNLLDVIVKTHPDSIEAQARFGMTLLEHGTDAEFLAWRSRLPRAAEDHPEIWYVQGLWARRSGQKEAAIRCFLEANVRDPNHKGAVFQLSQLFKDSEHAKLSEQLATRSQRLSQLHYLIMELRYTYDAELARKVVDLLDLLDRPLEAIGWCHMLVGWQNGHEDWAGGKLLELLQRLRPGDRLTLPPGHLVTHIPRDRFPTPDWSAAETQTDEVASVSPSDGKVCFANVASEVGIDFKYENGTTATTGLVHILQATGGGVGVVDIDQDGWQDLYFIQSEPYPIDAGQTEYANRLYRNLGNGKFQDISVSSGLDDPKYGQGISVGDYNCDGFPDLYVANFGGNRLYQNMGDGCFIDVTEQAGVAGDHWTTSCFITDLDGDALPEIYATNYALKKEVLERECQSNGHPITCPPTILTAEQDQLYHNLGDGRFENVTQQSGVVAIDGKGLGVVAADFEHRGRLNVFVANDTSANFYFRNETPGPGSPLAFKEQAIMSGLGFDEVGNQQACMGVAAGDANVDGLLDLFVTNFYGESNGLYVQTPDNMFMFSTRKANLRNSGFHMLGFGTQFIDGELDGLPDLIITNGHVDHAMSHGNPDRMPPQYLRNAGKGRFVELEPEGLGPYFQSHYFGRTLAVLDWNRDGRPDVCISHLDAPAALLTNNTQEIGNYLALQLRGTVSNRDAIGAVVTVVAGEHQWVRQLMGGNGYMVSNHRQLLFGLGEAETVTRLTIRWPAGDEQVFEQLSPNQEYLVIEGGELLPFAK